MRIAIVTDAWEPQVNGVVTTLKRTAAELEKLGQEVVTVTPEGRRTVPCPTYPEIRLTLRAGPKVARELDTLAPEAVHIATEGPLGMAARSWCRRHGHAFTTSFHTQFPEYLRKRLPIPLALSYSWLRRYHGAAARTMVPTRDMQRRLLSRGFENVVIWSRGVDTETFQPGPKGFLDLPRPVWVYAGRVAVEKNLEAFLDLDLDGSKLIVGEGPDFAKLKARYPAAEFAGYKFGEELSAYVAASDVFVFPSRTDTFGLVMLEAMACGIPVAAYPVTGPIDVVEDGVTGILDQDLGRACRAALMLDGKAARRYALSRTWRHCTEEFLGHLQPDPVGSAPAKGETPAVRPRAAGGEHS